MRVMAHAALAGCVLFRYCRAGQRPIFAVRYPDGQQSHWHNSRYAASEHYLVWWWSKNNIFPRYK